MSLPNPILTSTNASTSATLLGSAGETTMSSLPLGVADGEIYLKVGGDALAAAVADGLSGGPRTVTPHVTLLGASASQVIPSGAKGWSYVILTGTATVAGTAAIPAGVGDADSGTLAASLTITTASASSAYVRWNT